MSMQLVSASHGSAVPLENWSSSEKLGYLGRRPLFNLIDELFAYAGFIALARFSEVSRTCYAISGSGYQCIIENKPIAHAEVRELNKTVTFIRNKLLRKVCYGMLFWTQSTAIQARKFNERFHLLDRFYRDPGFIDYFQNLTSYTGDWDSCCDYTVSGMLTLRLPHTLTQLDLDCGGTHRVISLENLPRLVDLRLRGANVQEIRGLDQISGLRELSITHLSGFPIAAILPKLPRLDTLSLAFDHVDASLLQDLPENIIHLRIDRVARSH